MMGVGKLLSLLMMSDDSDVKCAMFFHAGVWVACVKYSGCCGTFLLFGSLSPLGETCRFKYG